MLCTPISNSKFNKERSLLGQSFLKKNEKGKLSIKPEYGIVVWTDLNCLLNRSRWEDTLSETSYYPEDEVPLYQMKTNGLCLK